MQRAVCAQAKKQSFHGYMPECGADFLRQAICAHYAARGIVLTPEEIFISHGASDDLGAITDLFAPDPLALIPQPAYPAYVDVNLMAGHRIATMPCSAANGFLPLPDPKQHADLIYLCAPNNPTGTVMRREALAKWIHYAKEQHALIIFDAAYEAFIQEQDVPHSIFEVPDSQSCAIEICSLSKTAGFTGIRCGYTIVPRSLAYNGISLHDMWVRDSTTKTNGVSYITQCAAAAVFSAEGQQQIRANIEVYRQNAHILGQALSARGLSYSGGINAPYLWMQCPAGMCSWECFHYLLHNAQIIGTPGVGFGTCGDNYFRLSAFGDPEQTKLAAQRIQRLF